MTKCKRPPLRLRLRLTVVRRPMVVVSDTDATEATGARQVPWREFFTWFRRTWRQGEHVSLIGPTGSGKTTLGIHLIALRPYVTAFAVKPQDDTMHKLLRAGYMLEREWVPELSDHIVLWPRYKALGDMEHMHQAFLDALNRGVRMGGWCFFIDEVAFVTAELRMERELRVRSEEHTSELQSRQYLVCRLLLEKKKKEKNRYYK